MDYTRRENTLWCDRKIVDYVDQAKELQQRQLRSDFAAVQEFDANIRQWQSELAELLSNAYTDQSVADTLCPPLQEFDLESASWPDVTSHLKGELSVRIEKLGQIENLVSKR